MKRGLAVFALLVVGCSIAPPPVESPDAGPPPEKPTPVVEVQPEPEPEVEKPAAVVQTEGLYRLEVEAGANRANEASGFVVKVDDATPILFTALSSFGPEGGLPDQLTASALTSVSVTVHDGLSEPGSVAALGKATALEGLDVAPYQEGSALGDVAAFRLPPGFTGTALEFADEPPTLGATVTLFAPLPNLPEPRTTAKVLGVEQGLLMLEHTTTDLDMLGAVGAPVLDAEGKVVGVYVIGGLDEGVLYGVVTPVQNFRAPISAAATSG